jgi:hypothetical protein
MAASRRLPCGRGGTIHTTRAIWWLLRALTAQRSAF